LDALLLMSEKDYSDIGLPKVIVFVVCYIHVFINTLVLVLIDFLRFKSSASATLSTFVHAVVKFIRPKTPFVLTQIQHVKVSSLNISKLIAYCLFSYLRVLV